MRFLAVALMCFFLSLTTFAKEHEATEQVVYFYSCPNALQKYGAGALRLESNGGLKLRDPDGEVRNALRKGELPSLRVTYRYEPVVVGDPVDEDVVIGLNGWDDLDRKWAHEYPGDPNVRRRIKVEMPMASGRKLLLAPTNPDKFRRRLYREKAVENEGTYQGTVARSISSFGEMIYFAERDSLIADAQSFRFRALQGFSGGSCKLEDAKYYCIEEFKGIPVPIEAMADYFSEFGKVRPQKTFKPEELPKNAGFY